MRELEKLKEIVSDLHWMARRYADGRQSYATNLFNSHTRALLEMGVKLNPTGDETIWARDSGGRSFDGLSAEEAAMGRKPDVRWDDSQRRCEEQEKELLRLRQLLEKKPRKKKKENE